MATTKRKAATHVQACTTPRHIAIVPEPAPPRALDGGAFAVALAHTLSGCLELGITTLSVQVWPHGAKDTLCASRATALAAFLRNREAALDQQRVRMQVHGSGEHVEPLQEILTTDGVSARAERLHVNVFAGYDGREELAGAVRQLALNVRARRLQSATVGLARLEAALPTHELPPVDLLIQTGGQTALSNFLLSKSAYAELLFLDTPWAEFTAADLRRASEDYAGRLRKFGGLA